MSILDVVEGTLYQSADEALAHQITTTNWESSPTSPSVVAIDETTGKDVTTVVYPTNSPSPSSDVISLSLLKNLVEGHRYRIEVKFTVGSNIWECRFFVECVF